jgi:hypothetical protein
MAIILLLGRWKKINLQNLQNKPRYWDSSTWKTDQPKPVRTNFEILTFQWQHKIQNSESWLKNKNFLLETASYWAGTQKRETTEEMKEDPESQLQSTWWTPQHDLPGRLSRDMRQHKLETIVGPAKKYLTKSWKVYCGHNVIWHLKAGTVELEDTSIARQWLGKQISATTDMQATTNELLGTMFSIQSVQSGYKEELSWESAVRES